jgi:hypothetical protein
MTRVGDLEEHIRAARASVGRRADPNGAKAGHLEGLLEQGPARLAPRPGESVYHHAGYLSGHLTRWMAERGREVEPAVLLMLAAYAAAVADPGGQESFAKPDGPLAVHTYATIRTEKKHGRALPEPDERMMFGWLLEQAGQLPTPQLTAKMERLRHRRQERLGL